ncbi:hypothetical protein JT189_07355 [Helicobacter pylori]|nr:hypothetical protein [Helicobacter pylori]MCQ2836245.1 hypothetical protein [Helicobacter pylori]
MFFKTYQKLLGASCLALCLVGCGSDSSEPLVEVEKNSFNSTVKIISKADNIEIQDLKLNRGNCEHDENFLVKLIQERANARRSVAEKEEAIKNHQAEIARLQKNLEELTQWVQQFNSLDKFWENIINAPSESEHDKIPGKFKLLSRTLGSDSMVVFPSSAEADLLSIEIYLLGLGEDFNDFHDPIFLAKKLLSPTSKNTLGEGALTILSFVLTKRIEFAIEDTKNSKDYPYINLKELKKLIDSIVDKYGHSTHGFLVVDDVGNYKVSKKGLQSLAKLKSMWPSVEKFYFAYLKEVIPRHAKEITDRMISSEEKPIKANQVKLTEAMQNIDKMEKIIKDSESKKNTMAVDLKFGETFTAHYKCQNLIEVEVKTNKGTWTFNFNR